jgi:hypothetical protein
MRRISRHIICLLALILAWQGSFAQKPNKLIVANDHLVLLIDLKSTREQIDSLLRVAGITSTKADALLRGDFSAVKKEGWNVTKQSNNQLQLDLSLSNMPRGGLVAPFQITTNLNRTEGRPGYPAEVLYGINKFNRQTVQELPSGLVRFFLPGNTNARRVILSGSFNDWTTMQGQMKKTDSGWVTDIKLEPGKYAYKYIVNGNWTTDPFNLLREGDGNGNTNSIYYKYNYTFKLSGFATANRVVIAGSFNNWNETELALSQVAGGWQRRLYLHDGMYAYRFRIDGRWITDPTNPNTKKDDSGVKSVLNLGESHNFALKGFTNAREVCVAGSFNGWKPNDIFLRRVADGWQLPYTFSAGNYQYKFIVDGRWITDPTNPHKAQDGGVINSFFSVKPNHTFHLRGFTNARNVVISGNFSNWNEDGPTMRRDGDGWSISLRLKPGKVLYKFIVDGNWMLDNTNKQWEQNEHNTGNSVVWIN